MIIYKQFYAIAILVLLLAILLLFLLRTFLPHPLKEAQQQVLIGPLSFFFSIYAFFLSFAMITLWQTYNDVQNSVVKEANAVMVCHHLSHRIADSGDFRKALADYAQSVIEEEWPAMAKDRESNHTDALQERVFRET